MFLFKHKQKDTKCKVGIQFTRLLRYLSVYRLASAFPNQLLKGRSLSWRDQGCTVHPRGAGLLTIMGGSWSEASATGGTAGLGVDEAGSAETQAGAGEEPLAAETDTNRAEHLKEAHAEHQAPPSKQEGCSLAGGPNSPTLDPLSRFFELPCPLL